MSSRRLPSAVQRFVATEASGGVVLVVAAVVALVWANSPWRHGYESLWHTAVTVRVGDVSFAEDLRHVVNDGLMAVFFFVVGLEIKRELVLGELTDRRVAALPVVAALGGMVVPALVYLAFTAGTPATHGWGIPMATDIAFAVGVLALVGRHAPSGLKVLLLTLAIVDDVGAIVVIALFYAGTVHGAALAWAVAGVAASAVLRRVRVDWLPLHAAIAVAVWYATWRSGVHATIAGVALGLVIPARPVAPAGDEEGTSPLEALEARLHPFSSFVVLPVFALANAGVRLRSSVLHAPHAAAVVAAVAVGLVLGKLVGVFVGARIAVATGLGALPAGVRWVHVAGLAALAGIGFTVALLVTGLAFGDTALGDAGRVAILGSSVIAAGLGAGLLALTSRRRAS